MYIELGDAAQALKSAEAALDSLPADDPGGMKPYAQQAEARALALAGRNEEALAEIDTVIESFLAGGSAADSFEVQRAQRYRAEFLAQAGRDAEALDAASRPARIDRPLAMPRRSSGDWCSMRWAKRSAKRETVKSLNLRMKQPAPNYSSNFL